MFIATALSFPDIPAPSDQERVTQFYANFGKGLPCTLCREHYAAGIAQSPPDVSSRQRLVLWTIDVHNRVNASLGKPKMDTRSALQHWSNHFNTSFMVPGFEDIVPQSSGLAVGLGMLTLAAVLNQQRVNSA